MSEPHNFDRRATDPHVSQLSLRMGALENRVESLEMETRDNNRELRANTVLTQQTHQRTEEMYEIFEPARNGFRMIGGVGNAGLKVIELGGKIAKPLIFIGALGVGVVAYFKTGSFQWPSWFK